MEWGEQFQDELTDEYLSVTLARVSDHERRIALEAHGRRARALADAIDAAVVAAIG